jgi:hypothetical protein
VSDDKTRSEFPRKPSTCEGNEIAWSVEARSSVGPQNCMGQLFGEQWKRVDYERGATGVPDGGPIFEGRYFGLLGYHAAQALRYWFLANLSAAYKGTGVETRLVKHQIKYSRSATAVEAEELGPDEWRKM